MEVGAQRRMEEVGEKKVEEVAKGREACRKRGRGGMGLGGRRIEWRD